MHYQSFPKKKFPCSGQSWDEIINRIFASLHASGGNRGFPEIRSATSMAERESVCPMYGLGFCTTMDDMGKVKNVVVDY